VRHSLHLRGGLSFTLVELLVATAVIAIRKVWEQHDR